MNENEFNNRLKQLTNTEREVLQRFLQGQSDCEIAEFIEKGTIRTHICNICDKFGLISETIHGFSRRGDLIELFIKYGRSWVSNSILEEKGCPSNHYFDGIDFNLYIKEGLECFYRFDR